MEKAFDNEFKLFESKSVEYLFCHFERSPLRRTDRGTERNLRHIFGNQILHDVQNDKNSIITAANISIYSSYLTKIISHIKP